MWKYVASTHSRMAGPLSFTTMQPLTSPTSQGRKNASQAFPFRMASFGLCQGISTWQNTLPKEGEEEYGEEYEEEGEERLTFTCRQQ